MSKMQDIIDSMNAKLGKETSAMIADDISQMLSFESESTKTIQNKDKEISRLKDNNEKLITANGNLLQQISSESEEILSPKQQEAETPKEPFNFESVFDKNGNFKKTM